MKNISLRPQNLDERTSRLLEERELVHFIRHPSEQFRKGLKVNFYKGENFIANFHSFHSVTITYTDIFLAYHPKGCNEIVMLWDSLTRTQPLYFVFSLWKNNEYLKRLSIQYLSEEDYIVLRFPFNDPQYSSFIIWSETVHCELTDQYHQDLANPSFFVLEPDPLQIIQTNELNYGVQLVLKI